MSRDDNRERWQLQTSRTGGNGLEVAFTGRWCMDQALPFPDRLAAELADGIDRLTFKTDLSSWDSGFLAFISRLLKLCEERKIRVEREGLPEGVRQLLAMAEAAPVQKLAGTGQSDESLLFRTGSAMLAVFRDGPAMLGFLGEIIISFSRLATGKTRMRWGDLWWEVEEAGPRALLIVSVISFLVGLILAYLGADQLRMVGAQIFIADLVAIGMVREVGALMTGVIIAGRTGSAFAAKLGTMQVNEEIDAFRTLGISPIDFLVLPRVVALILMVPLLTLYASFVGILAGLLISTTIFGIGLFEYYNETVAALDLSHFMVGLVKGTVYGSVVAYSGCLRGMQCGRNATAVGEAATSAVVTGILLITISASVLTVFFYQLGI